MKIEQELAKLVPSGETMLTIGVFDSVHRGHQHLLDSLRQKASERGLLSGVVTFDRHPQAVLSPETKPSCLVSLSQRISRIKSLGIELVCVLTFDRELAQLTAREFILLMCGYLKMRGLVIGPDFALGRGRKGNVTTLQALGNELDFTVDAVAPLTMEGQVVSSTAIRNALAQGDIVTANRLLGRRFSLDGTVIRGVERGRILGFPTANIAIAPEQALPADGVYITWAYVNNRPHKAVMNIGRRPTFSEGERTVEVHLLDFQGELYGEQFKIELVEQIRGETRFANAEELKTQIGKDVERTKAVLELD